MPLTITATDNANNTGATVIVSGSAGGSTNTIHVRRADAPDWIVTAITRIGDGSVQVPLGTLTVYGPWFIRVSNSGGDVTSGALVNPTMGYSTPWHSCLIAVQNRIIAENLPGIGERVYRGDDVETLAISVAKWPAVLCVIPPKPEQRQPVDNTRTLFVLPLLVLLVDNKGHAFEQLEKRLFWRWRVMGLFDRKPLGDASQRATIAPEPYSPLDSQKYDLWQSAFGISCEVRRLIGED